MPPNLSWRRLRCSSMRFILCSPVRSFFVLLCFLIDEVTVQSQLADDGVDLAKREWSFPFQPMANEPIRVCRDSGVQCGSTRIISKRSAMLARQRCDSENASNLGLAAPFVHALGERADVRTNPGAASKQLRGSARRFRRSVFFGNPMVAALLA